MRIRGTKPEFWRSRRVGSVSWSVVYDGPIPARVNTIAPAGSDREYVYLFFDASDALVYVGRSFRPADRFTKHRRKAWWSQVASVTIIKVLEEPIWLRMPWQKNGPNTARLEAFAIEELRPWANIAAPAREAMR